MGYALYYFVILVNKQDIYGKPHKEGMDGITGLDYQGFWGTKIFSPQ